jgi:hypothetical protein
MKPPTPKNTTPTPPTSRTGHGDVPGSSAKASANTTKPSIARARQAVATSTTPVRRAE